MYCTDRFPMLPWDFKKTNHFAANFKKTASSGDVFRALAGPRIARDGRHATHVFDLADGCPLPGRQTDVFRRGPSGHSAFLLATPWDPFGASGRSSNEALDLRNPGTWTKLKGII